MSHRGSGSSQCNHYSVCWGALALAGGTLFSVMDSERLTRFVPTNFVPAWWLPGAHLQTLGARLLRPRGGVPFHRERVELPDGDFVDLDFAFAERSDSRPLVLVLHGLEGSARSAYVLETYRALRDAGLGAVGLNFRSCSGELNRLPRLYHSGDTDDLRFVLDLLARRLPGRPMGAIGFSLGGNVLLKYLGEVGHAITPIRAAAAVSVPYDLAAGANYLERIGGRLYAIYLLLKLRRKVAAKWRSLPPTVDVHRATRALTFREFDEAATAPLHRFADAADYYRQSSSAYYLSRIRLPTLLIHSYDDPFLPANAMPIDASTTNRWIMSAFTKRGGHVGFVSGSVPWQPRFWAEREVGRFMQSMLHHLPPD